MRFFLVQTSMTSKAEEKVSKDGKVEDSDPTTYGSLGLSVIKIGLLLLWAGFLALLILLNAALTWWMMLILVLPLYLVSEWAGEKVFATKYGWSTEQVGFSPKRIVFGVLLVLGAAAVVFLLSRLFN